MEKDLENLQSIVAKSNLAATAGEFVPRLNPTNSQQNVSGRIESNDCIWDISSSNNNRGSSSSSDTIIGNIFYGTPDTASSANYNRSTNIASTYESSVIAGSSNVRHKAKSMQKKNNMYPNAHGGCKVFKYSNSWEKPNLGHSQNGYRGPWNGKYSGRHFNDSVSENKYFSRSNRKSKYKVYKPPTRDENYEERIEENDFYSGMSSSSNYNNLECQTQSWRNEEKYLKPYQESQVLKEHIGFKGNKYKQKIKGEFVSNYKESVDNKNEFYKGGSNHFYKTNVNTDSTLYESADGNVKCQREQLINVLTRGVLECLVCCEVIHQNSPVWSCFNCFHVLHLKCVIKWAKSSKTDFGWRCPACQNVSDTIPDAYYCFCGKVRDPEWNHQDCPHSCGEICGKTNKNSCSHKCTLLCHPGPCPQCTIAITKYCGCQKTMKTVQCVNSESVVCDEVCGKELNCLIHTCSKKCHIGDCNKCQEVIAQDCFCEKNCREVKCTVDIIGVINYSCGEICGKKLFCGNHTCQLICHEGECPGCELKPDLVKFCPCGKTKLADLKNEERKSCTDPIPTCDLICGKTLVCGPDEKPHKCKSTCHEGSCPECGLETVVKCRCGHMDKMVACVDLIAQGGVILCDKRCTKKRSCGKHKCNQVCCTDMRHECPLPCNRFLQCGLHRCEETCHKGHCKPCLRASFEELTCECGSEVIFPPVPCGARKPLCEKPCTRTHACDHPPVHNCHSASQCPPCTILTKKYCHGRHELRRTVPCHQESFSCGLPCGKDLECGKHKCILPCHSGPCLKQDKSCNQPCTTIRSDCGHICGMPCHEGTCQADYPCKEMVRVTCECGHRFTTRGCHDNAKDFQRIATAKLASKMADLQAGQSIDLNDVVGASKKLSYKTLECNEECKLIERNRRLAIALQISNPDLSAKLTPRYSEYLKNWAKRDPRFCQMVHDKLTDLVQLAKQSKQKSRSYSFDPMNREKRHFIHEYCEHFGCESVAYDQEPKRNVVATAVKEKSWLPSMSVLEFIQKENSPRKVPVPVIVKTSTSVPQKGMEILSRKVVSNAQQQEVCEGSTNASSNETQIDYFDWQPQDAKLKI